MEERIRTKLEEIERKENVKILHCVESGSRAWGFASPDSDYDVRFIYVRPREFYLRLDKTRDVIEWQLDDILDINGWDLSKTLVLLHKSNPTLFEWNASPIVYRTTEEWERISSIIHEYFVPKSTLYHYLSIAKRTYQAHLTGETVQLKKYFYILRPLLACKWILDRGTPPPMLFRTLVEEYLEKSIRPDVETLLTLKMNHPERKEGKHFPQVDEYICQSMQAIEEKINTLPPARNKEWEKLNTVFLSFL